MNSPSGTPATASRRPRLSDAQTERRMLDAGLAAIDTQGLAVGLEHLSMEAVIAAADVSRASVYRRWPTKELFFGDLLLEIARATQLTAEGAELVADAARDVAERCAELLDERSRRDLVVDLVRRVMHADSAVVARSARWRTYVALHVSFSGLADADLRAQVAAELVATERAFTERRADVFAWFAGLVGYRLVAGETFRGLSFALGCASTGALVRGMADPDLLTTTRQRTALGSATPMEWTEPALLAARILDDHLEPDPDVRWDEARMTAVRERAAAGPWEDGWA
ncbi:TetR/AcrR family transcriptional regulator [Actinotalea sp. M2MS4P-6]|uniref:TetR/AcrR family transcriptional regulator n=1 Tax=Actinotalea sp. M2MS4P-6 TaxID=2983762 RepID=UPI0021E41F37|nr:TetR/AcrR family transcriptional regulator [Actinotalea sp. M2MS4P-6]MCV2395695.1 TetR/AcrR family transcriptional regulator [Actinotalea sp. M2MS4P-6]